MGVAAEWVALAMGTLALRLGVEVWAPRRGAGHRKCEGGGRTLAGGFGVDFGFGGGELVEELEDLGLGLAFEVGEVGDGFLDEVVVVGFLGIFSFSGSDWTISCSGLEIVGLGVAEMVNLVLVSSVSWTSSWSRAGWLGRCSTRWWTSWTVRRISRARAVNWVSRASRARRYSTGVRRLASSSIDLSRVARVTRPSSSWSDSSRRSSAAAAAISLQWVSMSWRSARTVAREILNDSAISLWELPCRVRKWTRTARRRCLGVICMAGFLCMSVLAF